jgi:hypothetical protein
MTPMTRFSLFGMFLIIWNTSWVPGSAGCATALCPKISLAALSTRFLELDLQNDALRVIDISFCKSTGSFEGIVTSYIDSV